MINLGRNGDNEWLTGDRPMDWYTGLHPLDCPGESLIYPDVDVREWRVSLT